MAVLATETWTGTDGAAWPAAWTAPSGQGSGTTTITTNRGRISPAANYAGRSMYRNDVTSTDYDVTFTYRVSSNAETFGVFGLRTGTTASVGGGPAWPAAGYTFMLYTNGTTPGWTLRRSDVEVVPDTAATGVTFNANTDYSVRLQAIGGVVRARIWSGTEPSTWQITYTDGSPLPAGRLWLGAQSGATAKTYDYDTLTVTDGATGTTPSGSGSGSWTFTGAGSGKRTPIASGSGSFVWAGAGTGATTPTGPAASGTGAWAFDGSGIGLAPEAAPPAGPRYVVRQAHGGYLLTVGDTALPFFLNQHYVVVETLS